MRTFKLNHVAIYAKHHYERTNLWEDLRKCLTADGYSGEWMDKMDVMRVISLHVELLPKKGNSHELTDLLDNISPINCWRIGYYTKDFTFQKKGEVLPEYDYYEAVVRYYLSRLLGYCVSDFPEKLPKADDSVLPLKKKEEEVL